MSKEAIEMVMNFYHITEEEALEHYTDEVQAAQKLISMKALDELAKQAQELGIE
jgi:hypothetical protein